MGSSPEHIIHDLKSNKNKKQYSGLEIKSVDLEEHEGKAHPGLCPFGQVVFHSDNIKTGLLRCSNECRDKETVDRQFINAWPVR